MQFRNLHQSVPDYLKTFVVSVKYAFVHEQTEQGMRGLESLSSKFQSQQGDHLVWSKERLGILDCGK